MKKAEINTNVFSETQMIESRRFKDALWKIPILEYFNKKWNALNIWSFNNWQAFGRETMWFIYR